MVYGLALADIMGLKNKNKPAAGINPKRFTHHVDRLGLPVFKIVPESRIWLASHEDLAKWIDGRKQAYFEGEIGKHT